MCLKICHKIEHTPPAPNALCYERSKLMSFIYVSYISQHHLCTQVTPPLPLVCDLIGPHILYQIYRYIRSVHKIDGTDMGVCRLLLNMKLHYSFPILPSASHWPQNSGLYPLIPPPQPHNPLTRHEDGCKYHAAVRRRRNNSDWPKLSDLYVVTLMSLKRYIAYVLDNAIVLLYVHLYMYMGLAVWKSATQWVINLSLAWRYRIMRKMK